jgi:hypothetical protein
MKFSIVFLVVFAENQVLLAALNSQYALYFRVDVKVKKDKGRRGEVYHMR